MSSSVLVPRRLEDSDELLLHFSSFTQGTTWYHYDLATEELHVVGEPGHEVQGVVVDQRFATAQDGTRVPYFVIRDQATALDGPPDPGERLRGLQLRLAGHAARAPGALAAQRRRLRAHHLRGGAEYGKEWFESANREKQQTTFDDLYAVVEELHRDGVTSPDLTAFQGHSYGGFVAGVAVVQRPELFRCVLPTSPLLDLMQPFLPGSAGEFMKPGTAYPSVLVVCGEHDVGCPPFQGRVFVARLREATTSPDPVHLRVWKGMAHGPLDPATAAEYYAEWLAFLFQELGVELAESLG
jgi:prolyl oligopeptidase